MIKFSFDNFLLHTEPHFLFQDPKDFETWSIDLEGYDTGHLNPVPLNSQAKTEKTDATMHSFSITTSQADAVKRIENNGGREAGASVLSSPKKRCHEERLQIIEGDAPFNFTKGLKEFMHDETETASPQPVISIMGCQSSGKSTLLNLLFGTEFVVMDSAKGRSQTTKGVWLDKAKGGVNALIMDLEGTDSRERGEDKGVSAAMVIYMYFIKRHSCYSSTHSYVICYITNTVV